MVGLDYLDKCEKDFIILTRWERYETGEHWDVEDLITQMLHQLSYEILFDWFYDISIRYSDNIHILEGIIRLLYRVDGSDINDIAIKIATTMLNYPNNLPLNDYAITAFGNWELVKTLPILEQRTFTATWLERYRIKIVEEIRTRAAGKEDK